MPQTFRCTPTIFNACLKKDLGELTLPSGTVLVQYVDDLLLAAETKDPCLQASEALLRTIAEKGYKLKKTKLQLVKEQITFLGKVIGGNKREISEGHKNAIKDYPKPKTVQQMLAFLGLTGYSRTYIPDYTGETTILRQLITKAGHRNLKAYLEWTPEAEKAFARLKHSLYSATALAAPDYKEPFHLDVQKEKVWSMGYCGRNIKEEERSWLTTALLWNPQKKGSQSVEKQYVPLLRASTRRLT